MMKRKGIGQKKYSLDSAKSPAAGEQGQAASSPCDKGPEMGEACTGFIDKPFVHLLLIVVITLIAYSNTFHVPFHFDDLREISRDHTIKDLSHFANLSTHGTRYVAYLSFAANYAAHGLNVVGYHIVNLAIHITNALLLYWLVILTFNTPSLRGSALKESSGLIALFSALFFASHPVQTEAVTYIVQRLASLATLFYLCSVVFYAKARISSSDARMNRKSLLWYGASLISAMLAMKTKEISFTLPVVIALYEFVFFTGGIRKRLIYLFPLFLTMLIIPLSAVSISKPLGEIVSDVGHATRMKSHVSRLDYLFTEFRVIVTYIRLIFLPVGQNLNYDYPLYHSFFNPQVFLSFLFLLSLVLAAVYLLFRYRKSEPHAALIFFGVSWFFIALSVESSVLPITDVIFEHRMYLPSIGLFMALTTLVFWAVSRIRSRTPVVGEAVLPILAMLVLVLTAATVHRNSIWKDALTFWSDVVSKSPNLPGPRLNLGTAYEKLGLFDKAIAQYRIILERYPDYADAHYNLGISYASKGWLDKAVEQYKTALRLAEDYDTHFSLGVAFFSQGLTEKAVEEYKEALRLKPGFAQAYVNLGIAYGSEGDMGKAIEYFKKAVRIDPDLAEAHGNLGIAYEKSGDLNKAIDHLSRAVELRPDYASAQYNLGKAFVSSGSIGSAVEHLQLAVDLQPANALAHSDLGKAYLAAGSVDDAVTHLREAVRLQPDLAEAYRYLGDALYRKGLTGDAIEQFRRALDLNPSLVEARKNMGDAYFRKGELDQAIVQYQAVLRSNPKSADVHYNLGVTFYNRGLMEKAIEHFRAVVGLRPEFAEARNSLGTAYLKYGALDKALEQFQAAVRLSPENPIFAKNLNEVRRIKSQADRSKGASTR